MQFPDRRQFLHLFAGAAALPALPYIARAQAYPSRPVRIIVGFAAGSNPDIASRLLAQWLSERRLGQPFIVDNRPGAASNIATEAVVKAPPDGYTLLYVGPSNVINATLYEKLNYNFIRDIAPVASLRRQPNVMVVTPSLPAKTVPEFIAYAKANPGKVNMASGGVGSSPHVSGELFKILTGVNMTHVPYRGLGAGGYADLISGAVHVAFDNMSGSIELIRTGKLRPLAVTTAMRSEALPNVPTVSEFVPGYDVSVVGGIGAPRNTPTDIIDKLNKEINAAFADPGIRERLADIVGTLLPGSPADFGKIIVDETEKWAKVIRAANIKAE